MEGLYGSIKRSGMDKVLACLGDKCGLDGRSVLVDVGAGLGRCGGMCTRCSPAGTRGMLRMGEPCHSQRERSTLVLQAPSLGATP